MAKTRSQWSLPVMFSVACGFGQSYDVTTVAGSSWVTEGRAATQAPLRGITAVVQDAAGDIYVGLRIDHRVIRIAVDGKVSVVAGTGEAGADGDGGPAIKAKLDWPWALCLDRKGGLLITDWNAMLVRRVDLTTGLITSIAGKPYVQEFGGDGGAATGATLFPAGIAVDTAGNIFVADRNFRVRKISASNGVISTIAGSGKNSFSGDGGPATSAGIPCPSDLAVDGQGTVYFFDACYLNLRLRKIDGQTGVISTVSGLGYAPLVLTPGPAVNVALFGNTTFALDPGGDLWLASGNYLAQITMATGNLRIVSGAGETGFAGDNGVLTSARFSNPLSIAVAPNGDVLIGDAGNYRIRRLRAGTLATVAGRSVLAGNAASGAFLDRPVDVVAASGGALIADYGNKSVRRINGTDIAQVLATDNEPAALAPDPGGALFIATEQDVPSQPVPAISEIIRLNANGSQTFFAGRYGDFYSLGDGLPAPSARIRDAKDLALGPDGTLYLSDQFWIRAVGPDNIMRRLAGNGAINAIGNDVPALQSGMIPQQIALDGQGNLLFADGYNHIIRRLNLATNRLTTVAGFAGRKGFSGDEGSPLEATLNNPIGLAVDSSGAIYIGDYGNARIRVIRGKVIRTIAGNGRAEFNGDSGPALCMSIRPVSLSLAADGSIYVADAGDRILKLTPSASPGASCPQLIPLISSVTSATDFGGLPTFASGSWLEVKGKDLASVTRSWSGADFQGSNAPTSLNGSSVQINGKPAFVYYVSPSQINVQAPADAATGPVTVAVTNPAGTSDPFLVQKVARAPGLLTTPAFRFNNLSLAVARLADDAYAGPSGGIPGVVMRPARPGEFVVFYGIGFGDVIPAMAPGKTVEGANSLPDVVVLFGTTRADVTYAGLASGLIGLYQFNVRVPNLPTGIYQISLRTGGVGLSQQLFLVVQGN